MGAYKLDENKNVVPVFGYENIDWSIGDRRVAIFDKDGLEVSTVFLPIAICNALDEPLCFETRVLVEDSMVETDRYTSWTMAQVGHERLVKKYNNKSLEQLRMSIAKIAAFTGYKCKNCGREIYEGELVLGQGGPHINCPPIPSARKKKKATMVRTRHIRLEEDE